MTGTFRIGALALVLVLLSACGSGPTSASATYPPSYPRSSTPPPPRTFPPLTGPSRTFTFAHELSYPVRDYTRQSRFVIYDNGAFALQYTGLPQSSGGYTEANGTFIFEWNDWSTAGPWEATGTLKDDVLTVQYNLVMQLTDFEDAVYVLVR